MPAVTLAGVFCGLALIAAAGSDQPARSFGFQEPFEWQGLLAVVGVGAFVAVTLLGNRALSASSSATDASSYPSAEQAARQAMDFLPWSAEPWRRLGEAQAGAGKLAAAQSSFHKALAKEPNDWTLWFDLAQVSSGKKEAAAFARSAAAESVEPGARGLEEQPQRQTRFVERSSAPLSINETEAVLVFAWPTCRKSSSSLAAERGVHGMEERRSVRRSS